MASSITWKSDFEPQYTPWPSQVEAIEAMVKANCNFILADEMGGGKTGPALISWTQIGRPVPALVLAGRNAQWVWKTQCPLWGFHPPTQIKGSSASRKALWDQVTAGKLKFVICTREGYYRDVQAGIAPIRWAMLISDECHKHGNRKTLLFELLDKKIFRRHFIQLSGSLIKKGSQNLWGPLHLLNKKRFSSYWGWVAKYCEQNVDFFGHKSIVGNKNSDVMARVTADVLMMRTKKEMRPGMPEKVRDLSIRVEMTEGQRKMYNELVDQSVADLSTGDLLVASTVLSRLLRLRQIICTPKILDPGAEDGGLIEHLVEMLEEGNPHMVVFVPFTDAIPHIERRLKSEGYEHIYWLKGGITDKFMTEQISAFQKNKGIMICSIAFAESFDLTPATWAYFCGFDWDVTTNTQAEDRLHRGEIKETVNIYYPMFSGAIDETIMLPAQDFKSKQLIDVRINFAAVREQLRRLAKEE